MARPAQPFAAEWARFVKAARAALATYGGLVSTVYSPSPSGRASIVLAPGARQREQAWKVLASLRSAGWVVKIVAGVTPTITVDLSMMPAEE